jgi:hypothetical protein
MGDLELKIIYKVELWETTEFNVSNYFPKIMIVCPKYYTH